MGKYNDAREKLKAARETATQTVDAELEKIGRTVDVSSARAPILDEIVPALIEVETLLETLAQQETSDSMKEESGGATKTKRI